jgi:hypothetical protein
MHLDQTNLLVKYLEKTATFRSLVKIHTAFKVSLKPLFSLSKQQVGKHYDCWLCEHPIMRKFSASLHISKGASFVPLSRIAPPFYL